MARRKRVTDDQAHQVSAHTRRRRAFPKYVLDDTYKELKWNFGCLLHILPVDIVRYVFGFAKPIVKKIWRAPNVYSPVKLFYKKDTYDIAEITISVRATVLRVRLHDSNSPRRDFQDLHSVQQYLFSMNQRVASLTHICNYTYTASLLMKFRRQQWQQEFDTADEAFVEVLNAANENGYN